MEKQLNRIEFKYVDEYNNEVSTSETFDVNVLENIGENTFEYIVERFKAFLIFAQFNNKNVNSITYHDE